MDNPFEIIIEKLNNIENLLKQRQTNITASQQKQSSENEIMNLSQAATYMSLSKSTMYKHTSTREIPHFKRGKRVYFKKTDLDEWLTKNKIISREEIEQKANLYILTHKRKW